MGFKAGRIHRSSISLTFQSVLDENDGANVPENLRDAIEKTIEDVIEEPIEDTNYQLSPSATITVDKAGSQWTIRDNHVTYELVKAREELLVYAQDVGGSMAQAIERAFERAWREVHASNLPEQGRRDRRILFVAVAQGVISYLKTHDAEGFDIVAEAIQKDENRIESSGTVDLAVFGRSTVTVEQDPYADNKVIGTIDRANSEIKIKAEGLYS